jgi:signal transduction histidine kinase
VVSDTRDPTVAFDWFDLTTRIAIAVGIWLIGVYQRRIQDDAERLRDLAVAVERARIAHDLHDLVAHHISAIAMHAKVTGMTEISAAADTALTEMRRLLRLLADDGPADLRPEPSLRYLSDLTDGLSGAGFRTRTTITPAAARAPAAAQAAVYWVVREAITNVLRHAGPTDIVITVEGDDRTLTATVDNGPPAADHTQTPGSGLGLVGMRERVRLYNGTLTAGPRENGGWRVTADFHLGEPA